MPPRPRFPGFPPPAVVAAARRLLSTHPALLKKQTPLPPRPTLPDTDLKHVFLKGSGPGGQKINKTNSAVQLTHLPTGLVVKSQATRSRSQNFNIARRILAEKVEEMDKGAESRVAVVAAVKARKKASAAKKSRRKYRRLAADADEAGENKGEEPGEDEDVEEEQTGGTTASPATTTATTTVTATARTTGG